MEWSIFAIVQTLVIAFGVSIAFWLRIRAVNKQNAALRTYCDTLRTAEATPSPDSSADTAEDWSKELLAALDTDDPLTPVQRIVLEHAAEPKADFSEQLKAAIVAAELIEPGPQPNGDDAQRIAELEAQLEEIAAAETTPPSEQQDELRALLRQFTQDSREMMLCIQTLEKENAALLGQLTELGVTPVEVPAAQDRSKQVPPDNPESSDVTEQAEEETPVQQVSTEELSDADQEDADKEVVANESEPEDTTEKNQSVESAA